MTCLSTLNTCFVGTSQFLLQFHYAPCVLGKLRHRVEYLKLTVEHQQGIIHIGHIGDELGLHHELIVLHTEKLHLCAALYIEDITKEIDCPRCRHRQRVNLGCLVAIPLRNGSLRCECHRRQEGQLSHCELRLNHLDVEGTVQVVGIVCECSLDERLQLRVGKYLTPRQIAERGSIRHCERVSVRLHVAYESLGVYLRTLVFVVYPAARKQQC